MIETSFLQEKMKESAQQLEVLTSQMSRLLAEKAELETRNRILEQVVKLNVDHVEQLQTNKARLQATLYSHFAGWSLSPRNLKLPRITFYHIAMYM